MLAYIPYMDPMGYGHGRGPFAKSHQCDAHMIAAKHKIQHLATPEFRWKKRLKSDQI